MNFSSFTLIRSSSRSLYLQLADFLIDQIETGNLTPGDQLPTEREISKGIKVNRLTVRRAYQVLERKGLLSRIQGAGTFIAPPIIERQAAKLLSFKKGMEERGYSPGADVIQFKQVVASDSILNDLELNRGAFVYSIHRLRYLNMSPVLLERLFIPVQRFKHFSLHDLSQRGLYEIMKTEYGVRVIMARQSLEPVIATEYEARLLGIETGAPLMLEIRKALDEDGVPVEIGKDLYRGDRFRFITEFAPLE